MNVSCPQCSTVYRVDPAKVPEGGVRARCSTCGGVIPVGMESQASRETPADAMNAAFAERRPQPGPFVPGQQGRTPPQPMQRSTPAMSPRVTPAASPRVTPAAASPPIRTPQAPLGSLGASLPPLRPTPRTASPAIQTPAAQPRVPTPAAAPQVVSVPQETPPSASPSSPTPPQAAPSTQPAPGTRRPINPFLARDPSLRAKRLARALVSDMVAYYPAKHAEGLEKGTLKELFRDEIKKSYEEYVAQVGAEFARSTTHFQESLNEVLGAGRKIF